VVHSTNIFQIQLLCGYLVWALVVVVYGVPWLRSLGPRKSLRAIAALNAFRFEGLVFILPGIVSNVPIGFTTPAAFGDLATSVLAIFAFVCFRIRPLFWGLAVAFNVIGASDLIMNTVNAVRYNIPAIAGQLGAAYGIIIIYVPLLMIMHVVAFYLLFAPARKSSARPAADRTS
jgi:hypothetical protein